MGTLVLVVEDDADIATVLRDRLTGMGYEVMTVADGQAALDALQRVTPDLLFLDIQLPDPALNGIAVLKWARKEWPEMPAIMMSAFGTIPLAVEAMKEGATDFITKPFDFEYLPLVVAGAMERGVLKREAVALRSELDSRFGVVVSASPAMQEVIQTARTVAQSDSTVLLLGESGTGKDLLARSIHNWSARRNRLFMPVNCTALSEELLESELFGHERGAFTGAMMQKRGRLEIAGGGTVLLDEIGDLKPGLQVKLLRFIQNREFQRVGGTRTIQVDIRVIAATNRDLVQAVKTGDFREDLFFRLDVVTLTLPSLRNRLEDVPELAEFFLRKFCREAKKPVMRITPQAMRELVAYHWPGNVRELQNAVERAVVLKTGDVLGPGDFFLRPVDVASRNIEEPDRPLYESVARHKAQVIRRALVRSGGSQTKAAELLGLQRTHLSRLIKEMGLKEKKP